MKIIQKIGLVFLLLVNACIAGAQDVAYSPYQKFDFRGGDFSVIGKIGGRVYTYRSSVEGAFMDAYNDSMQLVAKVVLDFFPKKIYETKFIAYNDKTIVLYQGVEGNKLTQYAAILDATGRLKAGPVKLDETKTGLFGPVKTYFSSGISDDKKTIVVFSRQHKLSP